MTGRLGVLPRASGFVLVLLFGVHCGQTAPPPVPAPSPEVSAEVPPSPVGNAEPAEEDPFQAIRSCPHGDRAWSRAIRHAMRNDALGQLSGIAEEIASENPDRWEPTWTVGESMYRKGEREEAVAVFDRARDLARALNDPVGVAMTAYRLGWLDFRSGRYEEAERYFNEALSSARDAERTDLEAQSLNGLAGLLLRTGRLGEAHRALGDASAALAASGMLDQARRLRLNRAVILMFLGNAVAPREILESLYAESVEDGDDHLVPRVALTLGNLHRRLAENEAARTWYARVPDDPPELAALARLNLGRVAIDEHRLQEARQHLDFANEHASAGDRFLAQAFLGEVDLAEGSVDAAVDRLAEVIARADAAGADESRWIARRLAARAARQSGRTDVARDRLREAVEILERDSAKLNPLAEGMRFLRERSDPYVELAAVLTGDGVDTASAALAGEILGIVERVHARALRRALAGSQPVRAVDLVELQARLGHDELILNYAISRDVGVVIAIRRDAVRVRTLPGWSQLSESFRSYRMALLRPLRSAEARLNPMADFRRSLQHGRRLSAALIDPVAPLLRGVRRIYTVPDARLALIPLAAYPWPDAEVASAQPSFLGQRFETAVLPLAGPPLAASVVRSPVLLAGNPLPDDAGNFPELPMAATELAQLGDLWGRDRSTSIEAELFTPDRLLEEDLARFGVIHLATHAVASTSDPSRCAVHLSYGAPLGLDAIAELQLDASLVILSGCRTGEGELIPGEGVVGLGWALLRAGAQAVAASLWSVEDESAMQLMVEFHRRLEAGKPVVTALAEARRLVAAERSHPAYWAPFVVVMRPETAK